MQVMRWFCATGMAFLCKRYQRGARQCWVKLKQGCCFEDEESLIGSLLSLPLL